MADGDRASRNRGLPRWGAAALGTVGLAATLAGGCDVRDEPVATVADTALWPAASPGQPPVPRDGAAGPATQVEYVEGYESAARRAAAEGRPLLLVFGASWCRWSGELARGPLTDRHVVERSRDFVCVFVDADREPKTCGSFGVDAFPTVIVVDADGHERFRATGRGGVDGLGEALEAVPTPGAARRLAAEEKDVTR